MDYREIGREVQRVWPVFVWTRELQGYMEGSEFFDNVNNYQRLKRIFVPCS